jgi:hypothetical protein
MLKIGGKVNQAMPDFAFRNTLASRGQVEEKVEAHRGKIFGPVGG